MNWRHPRAEQTKQGRICVCVEDWRLPNPLTRDEHRTTYLPFIRHFSPRASSASATERGIPTTTSALFVRRLKSGNACASGPEKNGGNRCFYSGGGRGGDETHRRQFQTACRRAIGRHRSICTKILIDVIRSGSVILTCDSYDKKNRETRVQCD